MEYTTNYQLPTWVETDRIQMDDFNDMTEKIDTALGEHQKIISKSGNCIIVSGSYAGNGAVDNLKPISLTFDYSPLLVIICPESNYRPGDLDRFVLLRGVPWSFTATNTTESKCTVTWAEKSVTWQGSNYFYQANRNGETYHYIALLSAEDTE